MFDLRAASDVSSPSSISNQMRSRRLAKFIELIGELPLPVRILDVGGTVGFWQDNPLVKDKSLRVVVGNLTVAISPYDNLTSVTLDATDLSRYSPGDFDVVFSNSVIEHLYTLENQRKMAAEIQRVCTRYWIQTPNYWFPIEPHFHVPGWQWLPESIRVAMLRRVRCGWRGPCPDLAMAQNLVREVRLMTRAELTQIFPLGQIFVERFYGLPKSLVVYSGFNRSIT